MWEKGLDALKWFGELTPAKMINILLLCLVIFIGWVNWDNAQSFKKERDDFKTKYDTLYQRYTRQVDQNQAIQNQLKDNCDERFKEYAERKNKQIKEIQEDFDEKYKILLDVINRRK